MLTLSLQQSYTPHANFHYDSDDVDSGDEFDDNGSTQLSLPKMKRPQLQRRCANQRAKSKSDADNTAPPKTALCVLSSTPMSSSGPPPRVANSNKLNLQVPEQYSRYPYMHYADMVARGYMEQMEDDLECLIPDEINKLVMRYTINDEDGWFQLTHYLSNMLKQMNKPFISMKIVHALIGHFFNKASTQKLKTTQINEYYEKLQQMDYVVAVKLSKDVQYLGVFNGATMNYYSVSKVKRK